MITLGIQKVNPKDLNKDSLILDVRDKNEVDKESLSLPFIHQDSVTLNVGDFIKKHRLDKNKTLNILCKTGKRAADVAKKFIEEGYKDVKVIDGGIEQAKKDGLKIIIKK